MAYSELLKSFHRVRPYMRSFYVYGFRHRQEFDAKSARSYDNERRRVESWLGDYMKFGQDEDGKRVFLSVDSRSVPQNPLYRAFKAKSFTDLDITLHFLLMDLLDEEEGLTLSGIQDALEEYLAEFETAQLPDESSLRKKLSEYEKIGLVRKEKQGKQVLYYLESSPSSLASWEDAAAFFSEAAPLGVVGSYLLDKLKTRPARFWFKHHYILNALDSEVLCDLFLAMGENRLVTIRQNTRRFELLPLRIYISTQTGRHYVLGQSEGRFRFFRLDLIDSVRPGKQADGIIQNNPADDKRIVVPSTKKTVREALPLEDIRSIAHSLHRLEPMDACYMALLLFTGMRRGEVLGLKWKDVDFEKNTIHVERNVVYPRGINVPVIGTPKTDSGTRYVPIAPELRMYLEPQDAEDFIIGGREPITLSIHRRMMERIGRRIDLHGASAHIFRHSYATMLNDAGVPIKTIQGIIGHADLQTTANRYIHGREEKKQEAVLSVSRLLAI